MSIFLALWKRLEAVINPLVKNTANAKFVVLKYWKEPELFGIADSKSGLGNG